MAARDSAISRSGRDERPRFLPEGSGDFMRRRLVEALGLLVLAFALAALAALLTFNPMDPSPNHATDGPVTNLLGRPGAGIVGFLLPLLGLSCFMLTPVLGGWSWRLFRDHTLPHWWLRLGAMVAGIIIFAAGLAALPQPEGWLVENAGLGGILGGIILNSLSQMIGLTSWIIAIPAFLLGGTALVYAMGLKRQEWVALRHSLSGFADNFGRRDGADEPHDSLETAVSRPKAPRRKAQRSKERIEPSLGEESRPLSKAVVETEDDLNFVAPRKARPKPGKRAQEAQQPKLFGSHGEYELPPLTLLALPPASAQDAIQTRDALKKNAAMLETVLQDFGVRGEIVKVRPGPVVTRYELEPAPGTKTSRVVGLADDIARSMSAISVRVAVVPGSSVIGIELPNALRETVYLRELLGSDVFDRAGGKLPMILGKDIGGHPTIADLGRMPHLLMAGTTGSGKSVAVNSMILSLLFRFTPDQCKFIMIDPKMLELSVYDDIPHLLAPVVTEPKKAVVALKWTVREMEERYRNMSRLGVRNIDGYNSRMEEAKKKGEILTRKVQTGFDPDTGQPIHEEQPFETEPLPFIVVVVDEMADLMLVAGKDIEGAVQRLAQMARAAGIHLIMATQRPSVDVITGTIKANFPTRISFHVTSKIDSRTILGEQGAEQLLGQGDMLYMGQGGRIARVHGPLVTDQEVEDVVACLKRQGQPSYIESVTEDEEPSFDGMDSPGGGNSGDELYDQAIAIVAQHRKASTSFIQRQLQIGYNRAARIIEKMEAEGVVSPANHVGKREVLAPGGHDD
ncbi:FtsK/SpoIIIE family DNA translocase [Denitrobaculum tricleocarpae]|uniref:DNA translocase FtsK n=1 Tax=Denitrobaculum tricleocarpae TaxID=2591009 RepID=A0A545TRE5_9PROT|nr:DNA translocase FtsK 4TM domain-containing protein [Denitrobaculum tricleocarpae]TQV79786.1 cell division protein FtsK [Denitrobaculum tricleocarpae]